MRCARYESFTVVWVIYPFI